MEFSILFESSEIVVIDKSPGVLSVPSRLGEKETRPIAGIELQKNLKKQIFPVHRLDFEVSGILIFALNSKAHKILNTAFENSIVRKTYQAVTCKNNEASSFPFNSLMEWKSKIVRGKKRSFFADYGKDAVTQAQIIHQQNQKFYEWRLNPLTGRSHQLRLEVSSRGYPILGDKLYGSDQALAENEIALRCIEINLTAVPEFKDLILRAEPKSYF